MVNLLGETELIVNPKKNLVIIIIIKFKTTIS